MRTSHKSLVSPESSATVRTVFWGVLWRLLRCPFLFLSMVLIPRTMGVNDYGRYAFFSSVELACEAFAGLGYLQIFGRFLPELGTERDDDVAHLLHGLLFYGMVVAFVVFCAAAGVLSIAHSRGYEARWTIILGVALLLGKFQDTLFFFLYGRNEIGRFSARDVMRTVFNLGFVLALFPLFKLDGALWAIALTYLGLALVGMLWTRAHLFRAVGRPLPFSEFRRYLIFGINFYVPTLVLGVLQQTGNILIQTLTHSSEEVSYFDIANRFLTLGGTLLGVIITMLVPSLTPLHVDRREDSVRDWQSVVLSYCSIAAFLALNALVLIGRFVITRLISPSFANGYGVAVVTAFALFPLLVGRVGANISLLRKEPRVYIRSVFAGLITMLAFGFLLIPRFGAIGAAWAVLGAHSVVVLSFWATYHRDFLLILKNFVRTAVAAVVMVPFWLHSWSLAGSLVALVLSTLLYLAALVLLRVIRPQHVRKLLTAFQPASGNSDR
ncbi:MAG: lipopolysaccharide biosynthesis protein [Kiritimatiellia bacterium]